MNRLANFNSFKLFYRINKRYYSISDNLTNDFKIPDLPTKPATLEPSYDYNHLGEITFESLGLCSNIFTPVGWSQMICETIHVGFEIPWWATLGCFGILLRLSTIPLTILFAKYRPMTMSKFMELKILERDYKKALLLKDYKLLQQMNNETNKIDINGYKKLLLKFTGVLVAQIFLTLGSIRGVLGMVNLPVPAFHSGGFGIFSDLTLYDTTYTIPFVLWLATLGFTHLQFTKMPNVTRNQKIGFSVLSLILIPIMSNFQVGFMMFIAPVSLLSILTSYFIQKPYFRQKFSIPDVQSNFDPKILQECMLVNKEFKRVSKMKSDDKKNWKKAGSGRIPKYYEIDDKKFK